MGGLWNRGGCGSEREMGTRHVSCVCMSAHVCMCVVCMSEHVCTCVCVCCVYMRLHAHMCLYVLCMSVCMYIDALCVSCAHVSVCV